MATPFQVAGADKTRPTRYAPIFTNEFFTGLWTQRNPLRDAATPYLYQKFYSASRYDSLIGGLNVELSNRLTLRRRPGHSVYNSQTFPAIQRFYEFRKFTTTTETIQMIGDGADGNIYDCTGPSTKTVLFTKTSSFGNQTYFQQVGNALYFGDGRDQIKYYDKNGVFGTDLWQPSSAAANATGPNVAGAGVNGSGGTTWTNPNNVTSASSYATVNLASFTSSANLLCTGFGFGIPATAKVTGISVQLDYIAPLANGSNVTILFRLLKAGSAAGYYRNFNPPNGSAGTGAVGGANDLWSNALTPNDVNNANFGVMFSVSVAPGQTISVRNVKITVFGNLGPIVNPTGTGSFAATKGYVYAQCYSNVIDDACSSQSTPSLSTGAFSGKLGVQVGLSASPDPQVTGIRLFRTADGGSTLLELPTSPYPNTTGNITDSNPDASLGLVQAPGIAQADPPPAGFLPMAYYLQRIWGAVGNTLYRTQGPDLGSPAIAGNPNTAFNLALNFVLPSRIVQLVPTALGLIIFTTSGLHIVLGNTTAGFYVVPFLNGKVAGLTGPNALDVSGTLIWMMSSDGKVQMFDPSSGVSEVGFPIGDQLVAPYAPATSYIAAHNGGSTDTGLFITDAAAHWYRLNPTPAPETGMTWSPQATIAGGFSAVQSVETSPGIHQLLLGPPASTGPILFRDMASSQDNGASYAANAIVGSIVLAHPGQVALLDFITTDCTAAGSHPTVSVLLDEIAAGGGAAFEILLNAVPDPTYLPASVSLYNDRWYLSTTQQPALCRHLQIQFAWPAENAANELLTYTMYGTVVDEL
jgi:hypothetical protein